MTILLTNTGKRFNREWIFRHLDFQFVTGTYYAVTGPNGSGKSTLLQVIAGALSPSEGSISFQAENRKAVANHHGGDQLFSFISIAAPYLELIEEMTLVEFLRFHARFKPFLPSLTTASVIDIIGLEKARDKQIRFFSSGMKQRVKLAQSILSATPVLLLDEPCTNLDAEGIRLYKRLVEEYASGKLIIVSSNDETEYSFCREQINILDYK
ncbi:MAG: ATP-binding cassette domain-containing protein [Chitinophagaceae bacterium]|nr:ATP-binding cassette domain-containing protein [Chitinophagaceae bacterium]